MKNVLFVLRVVSSEVLAVLAVLALSALDNPLWLPRTQRTHIHYLAINAAYH